MQVIRFLAPLIVLTPALSAEPELKTVFDEDFKQVAQNRFKTLKPGQTDQDLAAGKVIMHLGTGWVRPGPAGFVADYTLRLEFPKLENNGDSSESDFGLVLSSSQIGILRFIRSRNGARTTAVIRLIKLAPNNAGVQTSTMVREFPVEDKLDGQWELSYRHGLTIVKHGGKEIGRGYLETPGDVVIGVTWEQNKGKLTCGGMKLSGTGIPQQNAELQAQLREAAKINQRGMDLFKEGKTEESLKATSEASMMYVKLLGEEHHDSANSLMNVGNVMQQLGKLDEAQKLFERTLKIRTKVLGDHHPQTGLTLFYLGNVMLAEKKIKEARDYYEQCLRIYEPAFGPDHDAVKSLKSALKNQP
jgi:tetratricopeptide (TPR) repeat protein